MGRYAMNPPLNLAELYACVCVKEFPAQALLRLRPELRERACVVMKGDPPLHQVCSMNLKARSIGMAYGMTKTEVETFPQAAILKHSLKSENTAKAALLECAAGFSPRVEECSQNRIFLCVIDIAGTEKLFGQPHILAHNLLSRAQALGFAASIAVSQNFYASVVAAKGLSASELVQVIAAGAEKNSLASLSLSVLDLSEEIEMFYLWGIRTLGALGDLPEKELIARMGQEGKRLRQLARGEQPHLFRPIEPEFTLSESIELDSPVEVLDALLFMANLELEQIILRATAHALALASVSIQLTLEGGGTHTRTVRPALPSNDRQMWLKLLRLDLEAHPPQTAVQAIALTAEPGQTAKVQLGLFAPQLPEPARIDVTLARLRAIVGEENVGRPVLDDTHAQDGFHLEPFEIPSNCAEELEPVRSCLAQRRIHPAEIISITLRSGRPTAFSFRQIFYRIERAYGPWVTSGDWWKTTLWGDEQWDVVARAESGQMLSCCIVRDVMCDQWQMVALYD
ncbi:MAG: DNA polymerase Y family protein [Terracidiphilus sp.]